MKKLLHFVVAAGSLLGSTAAHGQAYGSWDSFANGTTVVRGSSVTVNGWGADAASGTAGLVANVYVDAAFATQQPIGNSYRPDIAIAFGRSDFAWSGYTASFGTANLSAGVHTVDIWVGGGPGGCSACATTVARP